MMGIADIIADVIVVDFLEPTIDRLGKQLGRNIHLNVLLKIDGVSNRRNVTSVHREGFSNLAGEVRIAASSTAVANRYKYNLQCVFDKQDELEGFSGVRLQGAVILKDNGGDNEYSGFLYSYNEWDWGKKLRDF